MKLARFFEAARETIDSILALLEDPQRSPDNSSIKLLCVEPAEKLQRLTTLFSAEPQWRHLSSYPVNIAHYLNLMIIDIAYAPTQNNGDEPLPSPQQDAPEKVPVPVQHRADFFFLPVDPLTVAHNPECTPQLMIKYLKLTRDELETRRKNMLDGWQVKRSPQGLYFCNRASATDWQSFINCVGNTNPGDNKELVQFDTPNKDQTLVPGRITAKEYLRIHQDHGVGLIDFERRFVDGLNKLIAEDNNDNLQKWKDTFARIIAGKSAFDIAMIVEGVLRKELSSAKNGTSEFFKAMDDLSYIYGETKKLLSQVVPAQTPKKAIPPQDRTRDVVVSIDVIRSNFDEGNSQLLLECFTESMHLLQTLQSLPTLKEPYNPDDEELISEYLLNIKQLLQKIHSVQLLVAKSKGNSNQVAVFIRWLNESSMTLLCDIQEALFQCRYHTALIQLSIAIVQCLDPLRSLTDKDSAQYINHSLFRLKDNLINALLSRGQFRHLLYWLNYFDKISAALYSIDNYNFFLQKAADHNYIALVAQHSSEYCVARYHLDQAWVLMTRVISIEYLKRDVNTDSFYQSVKSVLESLILSYRALGTEEFEARNFRVAMDVFSASQPEKANSVTLDLSNLLLSRQGKQLVKSKARPANKDSLVNDSHVDLNWCAVVNLISTRRWLFRNKPKQYNLETKNGTLVLSSSKKGSIKNLPFQLKGEEIPFRSTQQAIIFDDFSSMDLNALKRAFSPTNGHKEAALVQALSTQPRLSLQSSGTLESQFSEEVESRVLKSLHYKSILHHNNEFFILVADHLTAFYRRCSDPSIKMRGLTIVVSSLLARALFLWTSVSNASDHQSCLTKAKELAKEAREQQGKAQPADSKALATLDLIDNRIEDHETIFSEYLRQVDIADAQKVVSPLLELSRQHPESFLALRLGSANFLDVYNNVSRIRNILLQRTLCLDKKSYQRREELLKQSTLFCFEFAFELFCQPSLINQNTNTEEIAFARIREEYNLLLSLQKSLDFQISRTIESYVLVVRSAIEDQLPLEARLQLLNQAFKLVKTNTNTAHSALILLRKIDTVISQEIQDPFTMINVFLQALFTFIKWIQTHQPLMNTKNFEYIAYEVCYFIGRYLTIQPDDMLRFELEPLRQSFELQLGIFDHYQRTLLAQPNLSPVCERVKQYCEDFGGQLNEGLPIIRAKIEVRVAELPKNGFFGVAKPDEIPPQKDEIPPQKDQDAEDDFLFVPVQICSDDETADGDRKHKDFT